MNPQYPDQNPYDFIMNPQAPQKPKKSLFGGNSFITKLVLIIGSVIVFMITTAVILNITTSDKIDTGDLQTLAQTQQEVIRVATNGMTNSRNQDNRNLATSVAMSVGTQQQQLISYLETQGIKVSAKDLALKEDAARTTQLTNAQQTSTYDVVFPQVMQTLLNDYAKELQTIYNGMSNQNARNLLKTDYDQTQLLLQQVPVNVPVDDGSGADPAASTETTQ